MTLAEKQTRKEGDSDGLSQGLSISMMHTATTCILLGRIMSALEEYIPFISLPACPTANGDT